MNHRLICSLLYCLFVCLVAGAEDELRVRNDAIIVRAIERMPGFDFSRDEHVKGAISRHLTRIAGTEEYIKLAKQFRPHDLAQRLEEMLHSDLGDSIKVEAVNLLCTVDGGPQRLAELLRSESVDQAAQVAALLGSLGNSTARDLLSELVGEEQQPFEVRKHAVAGLAKNVPGQQRLLSLAGAAKLAPDTRLLAGGLLARSDREEVRKKASELLPQPQQKDQKPLPPIDELASVRGSATDGMQLFRGAATCSNCHLVDRFGKEVGPDLSEIGTKLSREAMYTSILDPSAGISHNYETYIVLTSSGQSISGVKVSETADEVVIRTAEAIDRRLPQSDIEQIKKSEKSMMPDNLHHAFDQQGLVDIIEYMTTLTKK